MTDNEKLKIVELKEKGYGYKAISKELNISIGTITSYFNRLTKIQNCKNCAIKLKQTSGHRKRIFCSEKCRREWWKNHLNERNLKAYYECKCLKCGKTFITYGNKNRKYCSWNCYSNFRTEDKSNG